MVCGHPLFWESDFRLKFLLDVSDRLETLHFDDKLVQRFERGAGEVSTMLVLVLSVLSVSWSLTQWSPSRLGCLFFFCCHLRNNILFNGRWSALIGGVTFVISFNKIFKNSASIEVKTIWLLLLIFACTVTSMAPYCSADHN